MDRIESGPIRAVKRGGQTFSDSGYIWTHWTSVRKVKEGETTNGPFGFITTEPMIDVGVIHPKAMPVTLSNRDEIDLWMTGSLVRAS